MSATVIQKSIAGARRFGLSKLGNLVSNGIAITRPCVDATITVGAEGASVANQRAITVQLLDANGNDIDHVETFEIIMYSSAAMTAFTTTGGSTGLAIGTDGALLAVVAKKYFIATSEADGDWDGTYTDTGGDTVFFGLRLPNGRVITPVDISCAP